MFLEKNREPVACVVHPGRCRSCCSDYRPSALPVNGPGISVSAVTSSGNAHTALITYCLPKGNPSFLETARESHERGEGLPPSRMVA